MVPDKPSEFVLKKAFASFGDIRLVDIPMLDPYRNKVTSGAYRGIGPHPPCQQKYLMSKLKNNISEIKSLSEQFYFYFNLLEIRLI